MTRKMVRSTPSTTVWDARRTDSRLHLASGLQEGRKRETFTPDQDPYGESRFNRAPAFLPPPSRPPY